MKSLRILFSVLFLASIFVVAGCNSASDSAPADAAKSGSDAAASDTKSE